MDPLRLMSRAWMRLRALVRGAALESELDEELRFHLDHLIDANLARGLSPEAARREALLAMDGIERRKEECRDARGVRLIQDVVRDVRYAVATLRRAPAFTIASILTLVLGIGTTVAMFTVVNGVLLRPLPFPEPERLFLVSLSPKAYQTRQPGMADATYVQFHDSARTFQHLAAFSAYNGNLTGSGDPAVITVGSVTTEFFDALGVPPALGRTFLPDDGYARRVVLSDRLWRSRFASNPAIVGEDVSLQGALYSVIGVMPPGFDFPRDTGAWTSRVITIDPRNSLLVSVLGRLKPEVTIAQARTAFDIAAVSLAGAPDLADWNAGLLPLKELLVGDVRRPLAIFSGAVLLVLLVACVNVANLLLARGAFREPEIALRAALGAGRARLARQLLTESLLLSVVGAAFGLLLAWWMVPLLLALAPAGRIPRLDSIHMDPATVAFTAGLATITGLLFGFAPALRLTRPGSPATLLPGARSVFARHGRSRAALVVMEIALSLVLMVGAGLLTRSFLRLRAVDPGYRLDNVVRLSVELPQARYATPERLRAFHRDMLAGLAAIPDAAGTGAVNWVPLGLMHLSGDFQIEGSAPNPRFNVDKTAVSPGYFQTMGIPLRSGRDFNAHDIETSAGVAIVSRTVARTIDPSEDVTGRRISLWGRAGAREWLTVVGVVDDVKPLGPASASHAAVYQPYTQVRQAAFLGRMTYLVRASSADPFAIVAGMRRVLRSVDSDQPATAVGLMSDALDATTAEPAFYTSLLGVFALLATTLALVGTYGVIAYSISQRRREIGLRIALGAHTGRVLAMVIGRTVALSAAGVILGTAAAWGVTGLLRSFLFEITPTDPATFACVAAATFLAALLAGAIPAGRAARVDPLTALRHE